MVQFLIKSHLTLMQDVLNNSDRATSFGCFSEIFLWFVHFDHDRATRLQGDLFDVDLWASRFCAPLILKASIIDNEL